MQFLLIPITLISAQWSQPAQRCQTFYKIHWLLSSHVTVLYTKPPVTAAAHFGGRQGRFLMQVLFHELFRNGVIQYNCAKQGSLS